MGLDRVITKISYFGFDYALSGGEGDYSLKPLYWIREAIWPLLEGDEVKYQHIELPNIIDEKLKAISIDLCKLMHEEQRERIKAIESKSVIFIAIFGSIITVLSLILKDLLTSAKDILGYAIIALFSIITIYSSRILYFAIRAIQRRNYSVIHEDVFINRNENEIIQKLINVLKDNYNAINSKVDDMTMAQEYIKRIIYLFMGIAFALLIYSLVRLSLFIPNISKICDYLILSNNTIPILCGANIVLFVWVIVLTTAVSRLQKKSNQRL
jgi:hypothetical protein